ncbi:MAG: penicillin-binding protein [Acidobacteriaceae bacterium]
MQNYSHSNWNKNNRGPQIEKFLANLLKGAGQTLKRIKPKNFGARRIIKWVLYLGAAGLIGGSLLFAIVSLSLPDPNKLSTRVVPESTKIYARDGTTLLYEVHGEVKRTLVTVNELPPYVSEATVAIEDKNFYTNKGVDWKGYLRAIFKNVSSGNITGQGGSGITQQFVKNAILTRQKTITRKIKELVLSIEIEQRFSKQEILQMYLNEIPYGQNAYGIQAAAQSYFGKDAKNLSLAEAAYLAALPQRPSYFSPSGPNREKLEIRKNYILDQMAEQGYISAAERDQAKDQKVTFNTIKDSITAPHFVLYVQSLLAEKYGEKSLEEGGLKVITTLDPALQQLGERVVKEGAERNETRNKASNAALVSIDPKTGQILAMVGSRDYFDNAHDGQVNIALRDLQPGSSIKPYVYATAFKQGMSPATMIMDVKTSFGSYGGKDYSPSNYTGVSYGPLPIRKTLAGSLNVPAVKVLSLVGVQNSIDTMKDMGISADLNTDRCGLSLVLGGCEISLLDHTSAMGVFANGGIRHPATPILKVTDPSGKVIEEYQDNDGEQALDPQVAYEIVSIMTDNDARSFIFGSKSPLTLPDRPVGAKTGTTQFWKDGWTMGYVPSLVTGVWTGNNNGDPMRQGADGVVTAAPIWNEFMREALKGTPVEQFVEPAGIQHVFVDSLSGKLPTEYSPSTKSEVFASFSVPKDYDDVHVAVKINSLNGKLATDQTPPDLVETRVYTVLHSERPDYPNWEIPVQNWARAAGYSYPPTEYDDGNYSGTPQGTQVKFITPSNGQTINSSSFPVQIQVDGVNPDTVELYMEGLFIGSQKNGPYTFQINSAQNGWQTLMVIVRMPTGDSIQNSIRVFVNSQQSINNFENVTVGLGNVNKNKKK